MNGNEQKQEILIDNIKRENQNLFFCPWREGLATYYVGRTGGSACRRGTVRRLTGFNRDNISAKLERYISARVAV